MANSRVEAVATDYFRCVVPPSAAFGGVFSWDEDEEFDLLSTLASPRFFQSSRSIKPLSNGIDLSRVLGVRSEEQAHLDIRHSKYSLLRSPHGLDVLPFFFRQAM